MANLQQILNLRMLPDRLVPPGIRTAEPAVRLRGELLVIYSAVVLTVPLLFALIYVHDGMLDVAATMALAAVTGALSTAVLWRTQSMLLAGNYAAATFGLANLVASLQMSGSMYWMGTTPVFAAFLAGRRSGLVWLGISTAAMVVVASLSHTGLLGPVPKLPSQLNDVLGAIVLSTLLLVLASIYEYSKDRTLAQLQAAAVELDRARALRPPPMRAPHSWRI
jgi:hypothetical protein